ncbi:hypothetical protein QFC24_001440 [Naganishia onofrii]|uniref:Uncharacterized protein n=1 Tax=Naganishia onofrii TaxID=1851511 RepID=A0ACC2XWV8_9TREE|nr:hypothetical protein QFC24_001440 [Naganishia onofrii]
MDYDNHYAGPSSSAPGAAPGASYQTDTSIMRPANLPPLSYQTLGTPGGLGNSGGYRGAAEGGHSHGYGGGGGGSGPDRHAPRRGGYRGDRPAYSGRGGRGGGRGGSMSSGREREHDDRSSYNNYNDGGGSGSYPGGGYGSNPAPRDGYTGYPPPGRNEYDGRTEAHRLLKVKSDSDAVKPQRVFCLKRGIRM